LGTLNLVVLGWLIGVLVVWDAYLFYREGQIWSAWRWARLWPWRLGKRLVRHAWQALRYRPARWQELNSPTSGMDAAPD